MPRNRKNAIAGQFAARPIEMLESPAFRALSLGAHKVLARLEIEHASHGGKDNGKLPCTYQDFEKYGLHLRSIGPALREVIELGFVECTRRGVAGNAEFRQPSLYRLTYRHAHGAAGDGSHEWRMIEKIEDAEARAERARKAKNTSAVTRGKKRNPTGIKCHVSMAESASEKT